LRDRNNQINKQLAQATPPDTTAVSIYSPDRRDKFTIENIIICNTSGSAVTYRIFVDDDGSTYDTTTAIAYDVSLTANTTDIIEVNLYMSDPEGNLAVRTSTGAALTFTVNGSDGSI
jgi:UTP:GlnB (protein PII) uridylyltransferase